MCGREGGGKGSKDNMVLYYVVTTILTYSITKLEETNILIMKVKLIYFAISLIVF